MPLVAKKEVSSAVLPATAKLAPWSNEAFLSKYGLSSGSWRATAVT